MVAEEVYFIMEVDFIIEARSLPGWAHAAIASGR